MRRKVKDVMTADVAYVRERTPYKQLVRLLAERRVSALPVVDVNRHVIGDRLRGGPAAQAAAAGRLLPAVPAGGPAAARAAGQGDGRHRRRADEQAGDHHRARRHRRRGGQAAARAPDQAVEGVVRVDNRLGYDHDDTPTLPLLLTVTNR